MKLRTSPKSKYRDSSSAVLPELFSPAIRFTLFNESTFRVRNRRKFFIERDFNIVRYLHRRLPASSRPQLAGLVAITLTLESCAGHLLAKRCSVQFRTCRSVRYI